MTTLQALSDEQFTEHALSILRKELGLGGFARFLRLYRSGHGDYTAERHQWLDGLTVADIMREMEEKSTR